MKKMLLLGGVVMCLTACDDLPFREYGGDDLQAAKHQQHFQTAPAQGQSVPSTY